MRRYSEAPNTPTPFSKQGSTSNDSLAVGSIITIPDTGKAVLRYVGNVEGKKGIFAGIELLGESAALGKNSGDVNGIHYFTTKKPGSGLFMTYDKLLTSLENVETNMLNKRMSVANSPAFRANQTPRQSYLDKFENSISTALSTNRNSRPRFHNSTPPSAVSLSIQRSRSPREKELQRLVSAKAVVESERDMLAQECQNLKERITELKSSIEENEALIQDLQDTSEANREKLEKANELAQLAENKLLKQRKIYEEQKNELLEVIDQVETQVNENEQLYIGELKKLQEELTQKQDIIEVLNKKNKDLQDLYEEQKNSLDISKHLTSDTAQTEINNLKLTNSTQIKAIEQLREELKNKEERIIELNKESLTLKEEHISENQQLSDELRQVKNRIENYKSLVDDKEKETTHLRHEADIFKENMTDASSKEVIDSMSKELEDLREKATKINEYESQVRELTAHRQQLEEKLVSSEKARDKLQELETLLEKKEKLIEDLKQSMLANDTVLELKFRLESKEKFIEDLKAQLVANKNNTSNTDSNQIEKLNQSLKEKEDEIESLTKEISSLKAEGKAHSTMKVKLKEKDSLLKSQEMRLSPFNDEFSQVSKSAERLNEKENELKSLQEKISTLNAELVGFRSLETELKLISNQKRELEERLSERDDELDEFRRRFDSLKEETKRIQEDLEQEKQKSNGHPLSKPVVDSNDTVNKDLLEEKELEIELLKEELLQLKSADTQTELIRLNRELKQAKHLTTSATNLELNNQIGLLKKELDSRPTIAEYQELRSELELIDELRRVESKSKDKEIHELKAIIKDLGDSVFESTTPKATKVDKNIRDRSRSSAKSNNRTSMNNLSLNRLPAVSQVVDGNLQVYVPEKKDPTNGRALWCGLCEQDGHDSIDCPYENDIF